MKRYFTLFLACGLIMSSCNRLMTISDRSAHVSTAITTLSVAVLSTTFAKLKNMSNLQSIFFAGGLTSFAYAFSKTIFFSMTSNGRIERAKNILSCIEEQPLLDVSVSCYDSDDTLIYKIYEEYFDSSLPLIDAFEQLVYIRYLINCAEGLLIDAKNEGVEYRVVEDYCKYCQDVEEYKIAVDHALVVIKQHPNWILSLNANVFQESRESNKTSLDYAV